MCVCVCVCVCVCLCVCVDVCVCVFGPVPLSFIIYARGVKVSQNLLKVLKQIDLKTSDPLFFLWHNVSCQGTEHELRLRKVELSSTQLRAEHEPRDPQSIRAWHAVLRHKILQVHEAPTLWQIGTKAVLQDDSARPPRAAHWACLQPAPAAGESV